MGTRVTRSQPSQGALPNPYLVCDNDDAQSAVRSGRYRSPHLDFLADNDALDPDPPFALEVKSWFVRDDVTGVDRRGPADTGRDYRSSQPPSLPYYDSDLKPVTHSHERCVSTQGESSAAAKAFQSDDTHER